MSTGPGVKSVYLLNSTPAILAKGLFFFVRVFDCIGKVHNALIIGTVDETKKVTHFVDNLFGNTLSCIVAIETVSRDDRGFSYGVG